jgi:hypothetical protein
VVPTRRSEVDREIVKRMKEVEKALTSLDPSVRGEAFAMMRGYILGGGASADDNNVVDPEQKRTTPRGAAAFLKKHEGKKDADNVLAVAAWWYSQYGNTWFNPNENLRPLADQAGLTVSTRIDNTIRQMKREDKPLFRKRGASYAPTPHGERYMKKTFDVTKGSGTPPAEDS